MTAPLLFLSHATDRTGPPIYLLHLLRWLRSHHPDVDLEVVALTGGELEDDFHAVAPTTVHRGLPPSPFDAVERRMLLHRLDLEDWWWDRRREDALRRLMARFADARVVYANAAPAVELARLMPPGERTLISHVHELEVGLTHLLGDDDRRLLLHGADAIHVCSHAVGDNLVARHGVDPALLAHHSEMIATPEPGAAADDRTTAERRRALGLPEDATIVGSCGSLGWRKAPDLFLRVARDLVGRPRPDPVTFVWVGGGPDDVAAAIEQARTLGVERHVRFVGSHADPIEWFRAFDVFALPAREDPFPLVCLEALSVGCPVVAFAENGGMPELLVKGCGLVAPYPDVGAFADRVDTLLRDQRTRDELGARGAELVRTENDVDVLAPRVWADIARWL